MIVFRVEWETMVVKGSENLIELEEDRWASMRRALKRYITLASSLGPVNYIFIIANRVFI